MLSSTLIHNFGVHGTANAPPVIFIIKNSFLATALAERQITIELFLNDYFWWCKHKKGGNLHLTVS
jgi:hypothetical protein